MRSRFLLTPLAIVAASSAAMAMDVQSLEDAKASLFPGAVLTPADFVLSDHQVDILKAQYKVPLLRPAVKAWHASTGGTLFLDQVYGLNDIITYLVAVDAHHTVRGVEIVICVDGFCDIATPQWRAQLVGKKAGKWDAAEISVTSGATLSSTHIAEGVKKVLAIEALFMPMAR